MSMQLSVLSWGYLDLSQDQTSYCRTLAATWGDLSDNLQHGISDGPSMGNQTQNVLLLEA